MTTLMIMMLEKYADNDGGGDNDGDGSTGGDTDDDIDADDLIMILQRSAMLICNDMTGYLLYRGGRHNRGARL